MASLLDDAPVRTATSDFPELVVEWLPTQGPFAADGEWCDITGYVASGSCSRGRQYELEQFQAGQCSLTLASSDRLFDPENTAGPFYPWLVPMRQVRVSAVWPSPTVVADLTGASGCYISTPDDADYTFTNFEIVARVALDDWTTASTQAICSYLQGDPNRNWRFYVSSAGRLTLDWFPTGSIASLRVVTASATNFVDGTAYWLKVTFQDNVAGNNTVTFYYADDQPTEPTSWTTISSGTSGTSFGGFPNITSTLEIGSGQSGGSQRAAGNFYRVIVRNGVAGTTVAEFNPDLDAAVGATTVVSSTTSETWTLNGAATLTNVETDIRYPVWRGYITDWGQTVEQDAVFYTTIQARDAFALLELIELPSSAWALEVLRYNPSCWLRLGETNTARVTDSSAGGNYGIYDNVTQGATGLVVNDADAAVEIPISGDPRVTIQNPALITGYPFSISFMIQVDAITGSATQTVFAGLQELDTSSRLWIFLEYGSGTYSSTPGVIVANVRNVASGSPSHAVASTIRVDDGEPHHVVCVFNSASDFDVYVDGVDVSVNSLVTGAPDWPGNPPNGYSIGAWPDVWFVRNSGLGGVVDEFTVFDAKALSATEVAALALAAKTGWEGDRTGERVARFLNAIEWPSTLRDLDTGISTLGAASWSAGTSALAAMQAWADTEYGMFFIDAEGKIVWRSRHTPYLTSTATTSQATYGDAHSGETFVYLADRFEMERDETRIRNPVTASRTGGVAVTYKDAAGTEKYGTRTWASPTTQDQLDATVRDRAVWLVNRYKELGTRVKSVAFFPRANTALWPEVLGREIGERVTVKRTPLGTGNEISLGQIIEGVEHRFSPMSWTTTFHCSPVDPQVGALLILDDSTYGLIDTGKLGY